MSLREIAARSLPLVDLTNLTDDCTTADIEALCGKAVTPHGQVAAICIYSRFIRDAVPLLTGTGVKIATVVNFPGGGEDTAAVERETAEAIAAGADEIDLVMPYQAFLAGRHGFAETQIVRVKRVCGATTLKVILETGRLMLPEAIRGASDLAIAAGADFIKTSTGKVEINATAHAARIMLAAIKTAAKPVGFKAAGGVRTTAEAADYLALADEIMGAGWVSPATFRFGASGLLTDLLAQLDGTSTTATSGY